jgi:hypothetical protein
MGVPDDRTGAMGSVAVVPVPGRATGRPVCTMGTALAEVSVVPLTGGGVGKVTMAMGGAGVASEGLVFGTTMGGSGSVLAVVLP